MKSNKPCFRLNVVQWAVNGLLVSAGMFIALPGQAGKVTDAHGNVGYDTAAECDAAVNSGSAKFYQSFTNHPPLKRAGEASVQAMQLSELVMAKELASRLGYDAAGFTRGACDVGVGRSFGRDGVSPALVGKYVPFAATTPVNVYFDTQKNVVRATMKQCDNNFGKALPRPVAGVVAPAQAPVPAPIVAVNSECYATVVTAPRFETRTEQVVKVPASVRYEVVPATMRAVTEQVLVSPAYARQIPVPATYKTIAEDVVAVPETVREEPVPATYKVVKDQILVKPESKRIEIVPETYKTVTEKVMVSPERKELRVIPAVYGEKEETIIERPATTRAETIPPTFKTVTENVMIRPESVRYEPINLPMKVVTKSQLSSEGGKRLEVTGATYKTVTEQVLVKEATRKLVEVPAVFETVTERVKTADASTEWKRGRAWIASAIAVRPAKTFVVGANGKVDGSKVDPAALATPVGNAEEDVMCLVAIPEQFTTVTRQVLRSPATVREEMTPPEYTTVTRQVIDRPAATREVAMPASYQTVTWQEIDIEKLKTMGYKINAKGDIEATPTGERVLRAADVAGATGGSAVGGATSGAQSGKEAYVREVKIAAEYGTSVRQVIDRPATVRMVEVPAVTQKVKRRVVVTEARTEEQVIPAVYQTVTRQVVDKPASTREVVIPAVYSTIDRRVVDVPATTRRIPVPAVMQKVNRQVLDTPASFKEEIVPAVYKTETRQIVDRPATTREIAVPAQYETLTSQVKVADVTAERRAILCETNATPAKIAELQRALQKAGFNPGRVDGVISAETMAGINQYQVSKKLPVDNGGRYINLETVKSLGVSPF